VSRKTVKVCWEAGSPYHVTRDEAKFLVLSGVAAWNREVTPPILIRTGARDVIPTARSTESGSGLVSREVPDAIQKLLTSELTGAQCALNV
jgi:hypothetical protein